MLTLNRVWKEMEFEFMLLSCLSLHRACRCLVASFSAEPSSGLPRMPLNKIVGPYTRCRHASKSEIFFLHQRLKSLCSEPSGEDEVLVTEVDTITAGMIHLTHIDRLAWQFQFYYPKKSVDKCVNMYAQGFPFPKCL